MGLTKTKGDEYYSLKDILLTDATYYMIIGMRSNGKTFSCLEYILDDYLKTGHAGAIIRRMLEDIKPKNSKKYYDGFVINEKRGNIIASKTKNEFNNFIYKNGEYHLCFINDDGEIEKTDLNAFAYTFAISQQEHYKSTPYPTIYTALFDEFITNKGYLEDEFTEFTKLLSTIIREKKTFKIFMCGNTISKYCPYFEEMGLKHIKEQKKGTIEVYTYGESKLKVAVEYTPVLKRIQKISNMYFAFDNPKLKMITDGEWEISIYPHLPFRYKADNVIFKFYIEFDKEKFTGEVIESNDTLIAYIHQKTTPITEEEYPVYTTEIKPNMNYTRKFFKPRNKVEQTILRLYLTEKFFYQDNNIGETLHNYFMWSANL